MAEHRHVMVIPADRGGCGHYRLTWPAQAVSAARPGWTVSVVQPERVQAGFRNGQFIGVQGFPDPLPDLLVMQRVGTPGQFEVLRWASEQGIATVVDFDDAMWCIDRENKAWYSWNVRGNPTRQHWQTCDDAAKIADLVTVTTDGLARRYGAHGRVAVVPNAVPAAALDLARRTPNAVFTAGWAGFTGTHPGDLSVSRPAAETIDDLGGRLHVVADPEGATREWGLQVGGVGPQPLGPKYYSAVAQLDLMLVGLRDTAFNRSKSTLKVLEAGAVGVPSIAPANAPHRVLARTGYPVRLVESPAEWREAAESSFWNPEWEEHRQAVQAATAADWTIEGRAEHWAAAWERALTRKQRI